MRFPQVGPTIAPSPKQSDQCGSVNDSLGGNLFPAVLLCRDKGLCISPSGTNFSAHLLSSISSRGLLSRKPSGLGSGFVIILPSSETVLGITAPSFRCSNQANFSLCSDGCQSIKLMVAVSSPSDPRSLRRILDNVVMFFKYTYLLNKIRSPHHNGSSTWLLWCSAFNIFIDVLRASAEQSPCYQE